MYIKIAHFFKIYDHPVGRSSHINRTITGFGIFVLFGLLVFSIAFPYTLKGYFIIGLLLIGLVSYMDDLFFIKHFIRLIFQIFALVLMAIELPFSYMLIEKWPLIIAIVILGIGVLNAFNFMDGINGMLGLNTLVILLSFLWLNSNSIDLKGNEVTFIKNEFLYTYIIGISIFLGLNLRRKAIVFAGDTGSIALAFIILYLMMNLIFKTGNFAYLLLFSVFGIDAGLTVIFKLLLRENIFVPHRDFLFKKLVHVGKYKHVNIAIIYASLQALVSIIVIALPLQGRPSAQLSILFILTVALCAVYIFIRNKYTKKRVIKLSETTEEEEF
jgi:UDP-N-acetylmuramyl pentapeptide phosphotransferase/UDP-N-acetylglucosamine-1-phosphate transferase